MLRVRVAIFLGVVSVLVGACAQQRADGVFDGSTPGAGSTTPPATDDAGDAGDGALDESLDASQDDTGAATQDDTGAATVDLGTGTDTGTSGGTSCTALTTCGACASAGTCGWCASSHRCLSGTATGPSTGSCTAANWDWDPTQCTGTTTDPCASATSCSACAATTGCGWCAGSARCITGTSTGPRGATCSSGWSTRATACTTTGGGTGCGSATACGACTAMLNCGWCASTGRCEAGTATGPTGATCSAVNWSWLPTDCGGGTTGGGTTDPCASTTSCAACVGNPACGWCLDLSSCHASTTRRLGPDDGACAAGARWAYSTTYCSH